MKHSLAKNSLSFLIVGSLFIHLVSCKSKVAVDNSRQEYIIPDTLLSQLVIDTAKSSFITNAIKLNGVVDFNTDKVVNVFPLVSGNVNNVHVMPGDYVHAGEVLGIVKSAEVAGYNSALITSESAVKLTKRQLDQQQALFKSGLASQVDISGAEANYEQAIAVRMAAMKVLNINGNNKNGEFFIKAPIDGFIVQKNVNNGMVIRSDNNAGLFTISNLKNVWVQANIYEENIGRVHEGDSVDVTTISYPDRIFKGRVNKLLNILDPTSKVLKMRIILNNDDYALKPQMFATVSIDRKEKNRAVAISSNALVFDHSQYYVITIKEKKEIQIRPVEIISIVGKTAYIKTGLAEGERVIQSQALLIYGSLNS